MTVEQIINLTLSKENVVYLTDEGKELLETLKKEQRFDGEKE